VHSGLLVVGRYRHPRVRISTYQFLSSLNDSLGCAGKQGWSLRWLSKLWWSHAEVGEGLLRPRLAYQRGARVLNLGPKSGDRAVASGRQNEVYRKEGEYTKH
jgi:hypothetical protein